MTAELFLEDSYLKELDTNIIEISENKVVLEKSIFYPTGGGQEHDTGILFQNGQRFEVYDVKREQGKIIHYVKETAVLEIGKVTAKIDWERRKGLMRHHSLLHIIGAVVYKKYGSLSTGNKIYPDRARIDFNELGELNEEEVKYIVEESNRIIRENHPIIYRYVSRKEAEESDGLIKTIVSLLPPSVTTVRLVLIEGIDEQACGGTHVNSTGEIGEMHVTKLSSKGKNNKRFEVYAT